MVITLTSVSLDFPLHMHPLPFGPYLQCHPTCSAATARPHLQESLGGPWALLRCPGPLNLGAGPWELLEWGAATLIREQQRGIAGINLSCASGFFELQPMKSMGL